MLVSEDVLATQKHLERGLAADLLDPAEALPGVLPEEAHAYVERRPSPAFERVVSRVVDGLGDGEDVVRAHPGRPQRLMRVAQRRVCYADSLGGLVHAAGRLSALGIESGIDLVGGFHVRIDVLDVLKVLQHLDELVDRLCGGDVGNGIRHVRGQRSKNLKLKKNQLKKRNLQLRKHLLKKLLLKQKKKHLLKRVLQRKLLPKRQQLKLSN